MRDGFKKFSLATLWEHHVSVNDRNYTVRKLEKLYVTAAWQKHSCFMLAYILLGNLDCPTAERQCWCLIFSFQLRTNIDLWKLSSNRSVLAHVQSPSYPSTGERKNTDSLSSLSRVAWKEDRPVALEMGFDGELMGVCYPRESKVAVTKNSCFSATWKLCRQVFRL